MAEREYGYKELNDRGFYKKPERATAELLEKAMEDAREMAREKDTKMEYKEYGYKELNDRGFYKKPERATAELLEKAMEDAREMAREKDGKVVEKPAAAPQPSVSSSSLSPNLKRIAAEVPSVTIHTPSPELIKEQGLEAMGRKARGYENAAINSANAASGSANAASVSAERAERAAQATAIAQDTADAAIAAQAAAIAAQDAVVKAQAVEKAAAEAAVVVKAEAVVAKGWYDTIASVASSSAGLASSAVLGTANLASSAALSAASASVDAAKFVALSSVDAASSTASAASSTLGAAYGAVGEVAGVTAGVVSDLATAGGLMSKSEFNPRRVEELAEIYADQVLKHARGENIDSPELEEKGEGRLVVSQAPLKALYDSANSAKLVEAGSVEVAGNIPERENAQITKKELLGVLVKAGFNQVVSSGLSVDKAKEQVKGNALSLLSGYAEGNQGDVEKVNYLLDQAGYGLDGVTGVVTSVKDGFDVYWAKESVDMATYIGEGDAAFALAEVFEVASTVGGLLSGAKVHSDRAAELQEEKRQRNEASNSRSFLGQAVDGVRNITGDVKSVGHQASAAYGAVSAAKALADGAMSPVAPEQARENRKAKGGQTSVVATTFGNVGDYQKVVAEQSKTNLAVEAMNRGGELLKDMNLSDDVQKNVNAILAKHEAINTQNSRRNYVERARVGLKGYRELVKQDPVEEVQSPSSPPANSRNGGRSM